MRIEIKQPETSTVVSKDVSIYETAGLNNDICIVTTVSAGSYLRMCLDRTRAEELMAALDIILSGNEAEPLEYE